MRTVKVRLYKFDELSEEAQQRVIDDSRADVAAFGCEVLSDDYSATLKKFCEVFGIRYWVNDHYSSWFVTWKFKYSPFPDMVCDDKDVSGKYVLRFLNRHYFELLHRKTVYGRFKDDGSGKRSVKKFVSKCRWTDDGCPLTGLYCDYDILKPIRDFLKKPDSDTTLGELIDDCFSNLVSSWDKDYEYLYTDENVREDLLENCDADFYEDGTRADSFVSRVA